MMQKYRNGRLVEDDDGVLREGETYRVPLMLADSNSSIAGATITDAGFAKLAATNPVFVCRWPTLFPDFVRAAVLDEPCAAGRDHMEAVYAAYEAHVRDAWRRR